jgi:hypothetical protein
VPSKVTQTSPGPENSFKDSPLERVRTLFAGFVQGLFYAAPAGAYHWEPTSDTTEIFISDESPIQTESLGQRPGVSFTRGPVQFYSLGLDDMLAYNFETGSKQKSVLVPGTMAINCISRVSLESERLAWIIAEQLWANRELLMKEGFFEIGRQPVIGAPSPAGSLVAGDSGDEYTATTVTCPYQFYRTTSITPLGKQIVQAMTLMVRSRLRGKVGSLGPVSSDGVEFPFSVHTCMPESFSPASDARGNTPAPGEEAPVLPVVPHPLNPAQRVVVRAIRPNSPAVKPPSIGGRTIPLSDPCVPESSLHNTDTRKVKV